MLLPHSVQLHRLYYSHCTSNNECISFKIKMFWFVHCQRKSQSSQYEMQNFNTGGEKLMKKFTSQQKQNQTQTFVCSKDANALSSEIDSKQVDECVREKERVNVCVL